MLIINNPKIRHINIKELQNISDRRANEKISNALRKYDYFVSEAEKLPKRKKV